MPSAPAVHVLADREAVRSHHARQARVWEPAGRALLDDLVLPACARVLDAGCGPLGWLRILAERVLPEGTVAGTGLDQRRLSAAQERCNAAGLRPRAAAARAAGPRRGAARRAPAPAAPRRRPRRRGARPDDVDLRARRAGGRARRGSTFTLVPAWARVPLAAVA